MSVRNVKISIKLSPLCLNSVVSQFKQTGIKHKMFSSYKACNDIYAYVIFKVSKTKTTHVNVTKIKDLSNVDCAIQHLSFLLPTTTIQSYRVDNIKPHMK